MECRVREVRKARGLSVEQLARKTGYTKSHISEVERELVNPSPEAIRKISLALGERSSFLFPQEALQALELAKSYYPELSKYIEREAKRIGTTN